MTGDLLSLDVLLFSANLRLRALLGLQYQLGELLTEQQKCFR